MFGLEKKQRQLFEFDLEKELKENTTKKQALTGEVENTIQEIKSLLRSGTDTADFDQYGVLLHGYTALLKVLQRISQKK
ncbi:MAG: needle chaperone SctE [Chlamydiae bacterium]|nr:needle chaperone SctE [Chlamydiota bacterium]